MAITTKTLKVRIKDKHAPVLREWSRAVNFTWNYIIVGDVASAKLVKTKMAKSTLDAGWSSRKTMLRVGRDSCKTQQKQA